MNAEESYKVVLDQKRKANLVNDLAIDFEHIKANAPKVMYSKDENLSAETIEVRKFVNNLADNVINGLNELKSTLS